MKEKMVQTQVYRNKNSPSKITYPIEAYSSLETYMTYIKLLIHTSKKKYIATKVNPERVCLN